MAKLKRSELRAHLLRSVQILKKSLTYTAYCSFILTMLFFHFVMETSGEYGGIQQTQLVVSPSLIAPRTLNGRKKLSLQDDLAGAFSGLEYDNPMLKEVLLRALPKIPLPDSALTEYHDQLHRLQETTGVFSSPDSFSFAYEYWIEQLATLTVKRGVSFFTQPSLSRLMVELLKPQEGMSIYDPTVGTGGMLVEAGRYVEQHGGNPLTMQFYGREKSPDIWAICKMNMLAHGFAEALIEQGDSLQTAFKISPGFDLVLQDMPLSSNRRSGQQMDVLFLRHVVQSLAPDGKAAVLAPSAVAQHDHADFWRFVLNRDWLEAVISLPPGLLQGTPSGSALFVFNKQKPLNRLGHVLLMQAAPDFVARSRYNPLPDEAALTIRQAYDQWDDSQQTVRIVPLAQIEAQNYRLDADRYLAAAETQQPVNVNAALTRYRSAVQKRDEAVDGLMKALERLSYLTDEAQDGRSPV